jgi:hypothetical protein
VAVEWSRIVNTTTHDFIREVEVNVMRNRKLLAVMQDRGRVSFGHSGDLMDWKIRYKRAPMIGYADADTLTFSRRDRWKTAQLEWRGYAATDSMTKMERLKNKNVEAIVKIYSEIAKNLMDDLDDQFGDEFYINGTAAGNEKRVHGIETFMGTSGTSAKQPVGLPNSSYAGLVCTLGNYGGSWSTTGATTTNTDWPMGTGDAHYDFWAPLIVDYTNANATSATNGTTGWTSATKTWPNTCEEALRYGIVAGEKNRSKKGQLDIILLENELYRQFAQFQAGKEQLRVQRGDKPGGLYALGFADTINFEGCDVSFEYGIPRGSGYGWSMDNMELKSLQDSLFAPEGPDYDIASKSYRYSIDFMGNLTHNVRNFTKWKNLT